MLLHIDIKQTPLSHSWCVSVNIEKQPMLELPTQLSARADTDDSCVRNSIKTQTRGRGFNSPQRFPQF